MKDEKTKAIGAIILSSWILAAEIAGVPKNDRPEIGSNQMLRECERLATEYLDQDPQKIHDCILHRARIRSEEVAKDPRIYPRFTLGDVSQALKKALWKHPDAFTPELGTGAKELPQDTRPPIERAQAIILQDWAKIQAGEYVTHMKRPTVDPEAWQALVVELQKSGMVGKIAKQARDEWNGQILVAFPFASSLLDGDSPGAVRGKVREKAIAKGMNIRAFNMDFPNFEEIAYKVTVKLYLENLNPVSK